MISLLLVGTGMVVISFVIVDAVTSLETARGRRVVLPRFRNWLDRGIISVEERVERTYRYVTRYVITLSWYYGLHAFLKTTLRFIAFVYARIESAFIRNRDYAKAIRKERRKQQGNHLTAIAEHKAAVSLTKEEGRRLRERSLRGR